MVHSKPAPHLARHWREQDAVFEYILCTALEGQKGTLIVPCLQLAALVPTRYVYIHGKARNREMYLKIA